jgi:very-short-patch-repair endonuclease
MVYQKSHRLGYPIYYNADGYLLGKAREQRKVMTPAEKRLWGRIRKEALGIKFRRQHPIDRFIADFYCHEAKLVIEIDGGYHEEEDQKARDVGRTRELEGFGIRVIRFTNEEVEEDLEGVVRRIRECLPHPPAPSPRREGEFPSLASRSEAIGRD